MSPRAVRLVLVPALIFLTVSGATFGLAQLHPAKPEAAASAEPAAGSGAARGSELFADNCAGCHGEKGTGGGIGPTLAGSDVSLDEARATIANGSGAMPAALVEGQELEDVLAYLETILGSTSS